uniref:Uncharacterized protein n=1 Tax=Physcomitrium patens TaxID=3218 RepID=A0A2K1IVZ8_PHYPA|nr:hypothetical protein PHYPA_025397 [Physcomitrium patens]
MATQVFRDPDFSDTLKCYPKGLFACRDRVVLVKSRFNGTGRCRPLNHTHIMDVGFLSMCLTSNLQCISRSALTSLE